MIEREENSQWVILRSYREWGLRFFIQTCLKINVFTHTDTPTHHGPGVTAAVKGDQGWSMSLQNTDICEIAGEAVPTGVQLLQLWKILVDAMEEKYLNSRL